MEIIGHVWRKKCNDDGYKLEGGKVAEHQGFYFYRSDRLITDGGWCDIIGTNDPHLSLARVEINIPKRYEKYLKVRSDKNGVDVPASFAASIFKVCARNGMTFKDYIEEARAIYKRKGTAKLKPFIRPGFGIPVKVKEVLEKNKVSFVRGRELSIDWEKSLAKSFIEINSAKRQIRLNKEFRKTLLGDNKGSKTDFPILRTLLYFIFEPIFNGSKLGPLEKIKVNAIKESLNEALKNEIRRVQS